MKADDLRACAWSPANPVDIGDLPHDAAGKGESRYARELQLQGRTPRIVNGRGTDIELPVSGHLLNLELKFLGKDRRFRTGVGGNLAISQVMRLAEDATIELARMRDSGLLGWDDEAEARLTRIHTKFNTRNVVQSDWPTLRTFLTAGGLVVESGAWSSEHPWMRDPGLMLSDVMQVSALDMLPDADVVVLARDFGYLLVPRACFDQLFEFRGEVSLSVPKLWAAFPGERSYDMTRLITDRDEIFSYSERMYEYVVRYKSGGTDPNTGRKRKN